MEKSVSVIIPAYNKAEFTAKTVESVLAQTYDNIETIVVDDGSTDGTRERLGGYESRIKYLYKENGGACSARNAGIREARGEYLAFLDHDDLYCPEKIERSIEFLESDPGAGFVHTAADFIDDKGEKVGTFVSPGSGYGKDIFGKLLLGNFICNSTVVARRSCVEKTGPFDETMFYPADWDMWIRLARYFKAGYIDEPLTGHRGPDTYIKRNYRDSMIDEELKVLQKAFISAPYLDKGIRRSAISNVYYRYGTYLLQMERPAEAKDKFLDSIRWRFNIKALARILSCR
jgi:glycosyltransferase involved in cell wall biosynthesis